MKGRFEKAASSELPSMAADGKKGANKSARKLVKYEALPEYLKDNEYIRDYYRCEWPLKDIALSVFSLHNETLNIWTHLVGFMIFLGLTLMSLTEKMTPENVIAGLFGEGRGGWLETKMADQSNGSQALFQSSYLRHVPKSPVLGISSDVPLWPWFVFLGGAMGCLIFSSVSHLFACHSRPFYYFFWRLDYAGISLMIVCSFFAPIYYMFLDHPYWRLIYLTSITVVGILAAITLFAPALSGADFRAFRATVFLCMGFSGVIPASHAVVLHWDQPLILVSLGYEILMGVLYGIGAAIYVARIPERWKPGAFDIVGHSHQFFHVFVIAAALAHSAATLMIMDWLRRLPS